MEVSDIPTALALWQATPGIGLGEGDNTPGLTAFLARNPRLSQVAELNSALVGTCLCGHDGRRGMLYHAVVTPAWRRRGLARALADACLAALARQGVRKCNLLVFHDNATGRACWAALGFRERADLVLAQRSIPS
jgi:ribosomal protein S18 acetylase RimI-like enzyme